MCGICGYWNLSSGEPVDQERLRRMNDAMEPRGPDDEGYFVDGSFGMAARRLSIIDIDGGHQPIGNADGRVWIAYNGEVYNFPELRDNLISRGHSFRTRTDTETVLHILEDQGLDGLASLNGMFAFAVFDRDDRELVIARDRVGIKPLFYSYKNGRFVFGSDMKSMLLAGDVGDELDLEGIHHYLSLNYIPAPHTVFTDVRVLMPGHWLRLSAKDGLRTGCYWDVSYEAQRTLSDDERIEALRDLLNDSVKKRLLSDVPVGVLLSGGVDSSAVTAFMTRNHSERVKTFSVHFPQESYSEIRYARQVAKLLETEHHEVEVTAPDEPFIRQLTWDLGQPYADSSMVPLYQVCRLAREHVKVVLSGDGGDEVFAGYQTYAAYRIAALYRRLPGFLKDHVIRGIVERLPTSDRKISFEYKAKRFVRAASLPPEQAHYRFKLLFDEAEKERLYATGNGNGRARSDTYGVFEDVYRRSSDGGDTLNRLLYVDTKVYLPDDILVKVDRMSMANSLEARVPLLDHRIIEFAARMPTELKQRGRNGKVLLKRALSGYVPQNVLKRKKEGFNVPASQWLKGPLSAMVADYLSESHLADIGLFDAKSVREVLHQHETGREDRSREIWGLLMFSIWHRHLYRELRAKA